MHEAFHVCMHGHAEFDCMHACICVILARVHAYICVILAWMHACLCRKGQNLFSADIAPPVTDPNQQDDEDTSETDSDSGVTAAATVSVSEPVDRAANASRGAFARQRPGIRGTAFSIHSLTLTEQTSIIESLGWLGAPCPALTKRVAATVKTVAMRTQNHANAQLARLRDAKDSTTSSSTDSADSSNGNGNCWVGTEGVTFGFRDIADTVWAFYVAGYDDHVLYHTMACTARVLLELHHAQVRSV